VSELDWSAPYAALEQGMRFRTGGRTITETDLVTFSALTGDRHPQHTDAHWATSSRFGERIAHGMLLVSYAVGLVPFDPRRVLALRRIGDVVFKRPATIGETIAVAGSITTLRQLSSEAGLVGWRWDIRNTDTALICRANVEVLWSTGTEEPVGFARSDAEMLELPRGVFPC
jgi:3-hydroxybutyryl-CoA dehydratase